LHERRLLLLSAHALVLARPEPDADARQREHGRGGGDGLPALHEALPQDVEGARAARLDGLARQVAREIALELERRPIAVAGIRREGLEHDPIELSVDLPGARGRRAG